MNDLSLHDELRRYALRWPDEIESEQFLDFLSETSDAFTRQNLSAHFTGSAWLVSQDGERVLLMHHRKLGRWLQLGGHADGDPNLADVALREAEEESGLTQLRVEPDILDLDRHRIPARGKEPEHWHYDVRYVVRPKASEMFVVNEESLALAWVPIRSIAVDDGVDASLRRMAQKWLSRPSAFY